MALLDAFFQPFDAFQNFFRQSFSGGRLFVLQHCFLFCALSPINIVTDCTIAAANRKRFDQKACNAAFVKFSSMFGAAISDCC